jgi:hypothetical protein
MFFRKKNKEVKCDNCNSNLSDKFNFCPYCGDSLRDENKERRELGLLGRDDFPKAKDIRSNTQNFGITDKLISSLMNTMMKSFDKELGNTRNIKNINQENTRIEQIPNGIKISIGVPQQAKPRKEKVQTKKEITEEQMKKLSSLPRTSAKTKIKRLSDKVVYELTAPGIESPNDIFISKLENGYEIKAIGKKKIYTNSISIDLPLRGFSLTDNKLLVEFKTDK